MNMLIGKRCLKCATEDQRISYDDRIEEARKLYGDKFEYDHEYNRINYVHVRDGFKLKMKCEIHGWFFQTAYQHLNNGGCKQCTRDALIKPYDEYIERAIKIHNNKYKYDHEFNRANYINVNDPFKIKIICPTHGVFRQSLGGHVIDKSGCPLCNDSKMEKKCHRLFVNRGLIYNKDFFREKSFDGLRSAKGYPLRFDFWIPSRNLLIELDGRQHYKFIDGMHKNEDEFNIQIDNDERKMIYAKDNGLHLLRVRYDKFDEWIKKFTE